MILKIVDKKIINKTVNMYNYFYIYILVIFLISLSVLKFENKNKNENKKQQGFYVKYVKRIQDFWIGVAALIVLFPIMIIIAVFVRINLGSPIIFKQKRPGKDEKIFELYKFRTMTDKRDINGKILPDEKRIVPFGRLLRSTSLDELPELFNIIRGDMSIVGPRPLLIEYLPLYSEEQKHRHDVKPGLTGLAQISGRNSISWEEKFKDDIEYIKHISFFGDWKIIFETIRVVLKRTGIHSETSVTMEPFKGTKNKDGIEL